MANTDVAISDLLDTGREALELVKSLIGEGDADADAKRVAASATKLIELDVRFRDKVVSWTGLHFSDGPEPELKRFTQRANKPFRNLAIGLHALMFRVGTNDLIRHKIRDQELYDRLANDPQIPKTPVDNFLIYYGEAYMAAITLMMEANGSLSKSSGGHLSICGVNLDPAQVNRLYFRVKKRFLGSDQFIPVVEYRDAGQVRISEGSALDPAMIRPWLTGTRDILVKVHGRSAAEININGSQGFIFE